MSKDTKAQAAAAQVTADDEPDDWCVNWGLLLASADERPGTSESSVQAAQVREVAVNHRIGLILPDENAKLTDCYYEKKDWRACKVEVSLRSRKLNLGRRDAAELSQTTIVSFSLLCHFG
jgi:cytochrome c oxidase assembly factor 4